MHPRGRSRDVSSVALARQASEERRRNTTSIMNCYPLPSDSEKHLLSHFYLSPPSLSSSPATTPFTLTPPDPAPLRARALARFAHLDGFHAPIDPRETPFMAQVINPQPLPYPIQSRLSPSCSMDKPALQVEAMQRAREQARAKCRYETLARAEQVFAAILERSRRERLAAVLLRAQQEDELKERERVTREFERLEHERNRRRPVSYISHVNRSGFRVLARAPRQIPISQQQQIPDRFTYTFPVPSTSSANSALTHQQQGSMRTRLGLAALTSPNTSNTRSVSFDDIRASMGNVLFPITHGESTSGKTRRESELLGTLLEPVRWEEGERWLPRDRVNAWPSRVPETVPECEACASASLSLDGFPPSSLQTPSLSSGVSTSTSTSIASRPISWLSFGSRKSTSLIDAAPTTPSSIIGYFPPVSSHPNPQHSCGCARGQSFVAVDVNDSPLGIGTKTLPVPVLSAANVNSDQGPAQPRARKTSFLTRTWAAMQSSVTSLSSAAVRLQQAYVIATAVTLTATDSQDVPTALRSSSETSSGYSRRPPSGWRVQRSDVAKFTSTALHADRDAVPYVVFYLVELGGMHRSPALEPPRDLPAHGSVTPHSPCILIHRRYPLPITMPTAISLTRTRYTCYPGRKLILGGSVVRRVPCLHKCSVVPNFFTASNPLAAPFGSPKAKAPLSGAGASSGTLATPRNANSCRYILYPPPSLCDDLTLSDNAFLSSPSLYCGSRIVVF
jgi:hypothetical protein